MRALGLIGLALCAAIAVGLSIKPAGAQAQAYLTRTAGSPAPALPAPNMEVGPATLVELYTAQGCEACRSANASLAALADTPNVIVLTFPVDHWDYLGWRDTFARPAFSARQRAYAAAMGARSLKTPQVVINGARAESGAASVRVGDVIGSAPRAAGASVRISRAGPDRAVVEVYRGPQRGSDADVWLATVDPRAVAVTPARGENAGLPVLQRNVVTDLHRLGAWTGAARRFDAPCAPACVAIVQEGAGGAVIAAAALGLR